MIQFNKDLGYIDNSVTIWRYMSLKHFLCLIKTRELHFHRIDLFNDNHEGTLTAIDKRVFKHYSIPKEYWEKESKRHYVSCWIESPHELALMWQTYGNDGVVIKSSIKSLIESFKHHNQHELTLARVQYIDFDSESSQFNGSPINVLKIIFTKRNFFEQEKEVRLLYSDYDTPKGQEVRWYNLHCDINSMIEEVRLSPNTTCTDVIKDVIQKYNQNIKVLNSEI